MTNRSTCVALAAASVAFVVLTGCGSASHTAAGGSAGSQAPASTSAKDAPPPVSGSKTGKATIDACSLISGAEVNQVMGQRLPAPAPTNVGTFDDCRTQQASAPYACTTSCPPVTIPVSLAWAVPPTRIDRNEFATIKTHQPSSQDVSGLGDQAYCAGNAVYVLKGSTELQVFADTCSHAEALARIALGRL